MEKLQEQPFISEYEKKRQDEENLIREKNRTEKEKREAEVELRKELDEKGKELGVSLALPNEQLNGLDVRGKFCQQREFMIAPQDWGKHTNVEELKDKMRPFVSWETDGIKWHDDEETVRAEMAEKFPENPLYEQMIKGEEKGNDGFNKGRKRIVKIIQNWEKMKDEEEKSKAKAA